MKKPFSNSPPPFRFDSPQQPRGLFAGNEEAESGSEGRALRDPTRPGTFSRLHAERPVLSASRRVNQVGVKRVVYNRAREMYTKALEVSSLLLDTTEKEKQETERQRYNKCLKCLNQVRSIVSDEQQLRELEQIKHSLPLSITSPEEARRSVQELTALKQKCPYCRELYLELANGYLLQGDEKRALEVLSSVMPNLHSALSSSTPHSASSTLTNPAPPSTPNAYPFWIASWDADKLDLFNNDVSEVDVEFIAAWTRLFVMQKTPSMAVALWNLCLKEPRFRDWKTSDRLLQPFSFLSTWVVRLSCRWDVE